MANPTNISCTAGQWNLIGEGVTSGVIVNENNIPGRLTYVDTGGSAPTVLEDSISFGGGEATLNNNSSVDAYFYPIGISGEILVMF